MAMAGNLETSLSNFASKTLKNKQKQGQKKRQQFNI